MTRSLRACKPISSLAEFEGTLVLTRRLTRRSHVSSLSVCRHCAAHCVSQFVVKPHGPGRLKISSRPAPQGNHRLHLARSTISPQSNHTPLSLLHTFLRTLQPQWNLSVVADLGGTAAAERLWKSRRLLDHAKEGFLLYSFAISAGAESLRSERLVIKGSPAIVLWPLDKTQYATLCRRISLRTSTTSQVG